MGPYYLDMHPAQVGSQIHQETRPIEGFVAWHVLATTLLVKAAAHQHTGACTDLRGSGWKLKSPSKKVWISPRKHIEKVDLTWFLKPEKTDWWIQIA